MKNDNIIHEIVLPDNKVSSDKFLQHRRAQEAKTVEKVSDKNDPMASVLSVELNTTELCNRQCVFCPRSDPSIYPNQNLHMSVETADKVARDLASFGFKGRISLSGFGEPLLNKRVADIIRAIRVHLPENTIDTNTNGDKLKVNELRDLYDAGITFIYVNMYDGPEQEYPLRQLFEKAEISDEHFKLRPHWPESEDNFGLILNNRAGMVISYKAGIPQIEEPLVHKCYYPFSRAMVDWNGNMLLCTNDWGRKYVIGSVLEEDFKTLWLSEKMLFARKKLMQADRNLSPCNQCNVDGTLSGKFGYDTLINYYEKEKLI